MTLLKRAIKPVRLFVFFILGCCLSLVSLFAAGTSYADILQLNAEAKIELQPNHVQYLVQRENITTNQILAQDSLLNWQMPVKPSINLGKFSNSVWLRFTVQNNQAQAIQRTLEIRWIHLAELDMYQLRQDGSMQKHEAGLLREPDSLYRKSRHILLPIELKAHEQSQILLRVNTSFVVFLPMSVWDEDQRRDAEFVQYIFYSLAFGILAAMMLYNASLYIFTRDSSYFYYSLYVAGIIMYQLGSTGIGVYAIWSESVWMRMNGYAISIYASFLFATFFVRHFLDLQKYGGWLLRINTLLIWAWGITIADLLIGSNALRIVAELTASVTIFIACYTAVYLWIQGNVSARYFCIAWSFLIISTAFTLMVLEGVIPHTAMTEYGQMGGFVAEVLMLSFAMAERINRERLSREKAQEDALRLQVLMGNEREAKMEAQEELLQVQRKTNAQLEERVKERTQELERTMTNLELANRELAKLSVTDPLTKVHNRRYFDEMLHREILRSQRSQQPMSLVLVDIDHFKQFNDTYGHLVGDDCLRLVASVLSDVVSRASDLVARYGGEEFAIILPDANEQEAMAVAEKIRKGISELQFIYRGKRIPISASFGIATKPPTINDNSVTFIEAADKALYEAKEQGRNRCVQARFAV